MNSAAQFKIFFQWDVAIHILGESSYLDEPNLETPSESRWEVYLPDSRSSQIDKKIKYHMCNFTYTWEYHTPTSTSSMS